MTTDNLQFLCPLVNATDCECVAFLCQRTFANVSSTLMEQCYLEACFVSKRSLPDDRLFGLTLLYFLLFLFGLFGNLTTCLVICAHPLLQTPTNRYLLNLALADLFTLSVGLPFETYLHWHQYPWVLPDLCCHLKALLSETTGYVSVLTILSFSVERYVAICHSFALVKLEWLRTRFSLLLLWAIALLAALPFAIYHRADYLLKQWPTDSKYGPVLGSKMCMLALYFDPNLLGTFHLLFHVSALLFFLLPIVVIIILYALIAIKVTRRRRMMDGIQNRVNQVDDHNIRVTVLLATVVLMFFICYAPFQLQRLLFFYIQDLDTLQWINHYFYFISGLLYYLSTIVNPVLYNVMSARYRQAYREVINSWLNCRHPGTNFLVKPDDPNQQMVLRSRARTLSAFVGNSKQDRLSTR